MNRLMIACVACLNPARSIHATTFLRAVELGKLLLCDASSNAAIELFDDAMSAEVAAKVARHIIGRQPHAVVGHYASSAADAAAPHYAHAGIPLLLPAATASNLTQYATTWRLCDPDDSYADWLVEYCVHEGLGPFSIAHDGSLHGRSVSTSIKRAAACRPASSDARAAFVFAGSYASSIEYAAGLEATDARPLVLTDDAYTPNLLRESVLAGREVHAIGFMPRPEGDLAARLCYEWETRFGGDPGTYFWETVAALQIAVRIAASMNNDLSARTWSTVLGDIRFGPDRESRPHAFSVLRQRSNDIAAPSSGWRPL